VSTVWQYFFESWLWSIAGLVVGYLIGRAERVRLDRFDRDEKDHRDDS
jgi:uncharacterized membrane-anchored protein YhcB (DUF1043 family)